MAPVSRVAPTPFPISTRAHLVALQRSIAVAVVGLAVWIALACSAPSQAGGARAKTPVGAPEWTLGKSSSFDTIRALRPRSAPTCMD